MKFHCSAFIVFIVRCCFTFALHVLCLPYCCFACVWCVLCLCMCVCFAFVPVLLCVCFVVALCLPRVCFAPAWFCFACDFALHCNSNGNSRSNTGKTIHRGAEPPNLHVRECKRCARPPHPLDVSTAEVSHWKWSFSAAFNGRGKPCPGEALSQSHGPCPHPGLALTCLALASPGLASLSTNCASERGQPRHREASQSRAEA